jgi:hypothetical protein
VEVNEIVLMSEVDLALFVRDATKGFCPNGDFAPGAMGQDLIHKVPLVRQKCIIMLSANTV